MTEKSQAEICREEKAHYWAESMLREVDHIRNNDLYTAEQQAEMAEFCVYCRDIHLHNFEPKQPPEWYKISRKFYFEMKQYLKTV